MARFSGEAVERDAGEQREPDAPAGRTRARGVSVEPGVGDDEGRGTGQECDSGPPGPAVLECVVEELERDRRDQRSGGKRKQRRRRGPGGRAPDADPRAERQRSRSDHREEDCLADIGTLGSAKLRHWWRPWCQGCARIQRSVARRRAR
jgi:hypothetical protein